jgi:hypothetical protein
MGLEVVRLVVSRLVGLVANDPIANDAVSLDLVFALFVLEAGDAIALLFFRHCSSFRKLALPLSII